MHAYVGMPVPHHQPLLIPLSQGRSAFRHTGDKVSHVETLSRVCLKGPPWANQLKPGYLLTYSFRARVRQAYAKRARSNLESEQVSDIPQQTMTDQSAVLQVCEDRNCVLCSHTDVPAWVAPYLEFVARQMDQATQKGVPIKGTLKIHKHLLDPREKPDDWYKLEGW